MQILITLKLGKLMAEYSSIYETPKSPICPSIRELCRKESVRKEKKRNIGQVL